MLNVANNQNSLRTFEASDYSDVASWWKAHNWPVLPIEALPKLGFIVPGVCAGWLYETDSTLCWLEWVVSNPLTSKEERSVALDEVISSLLSRAKELGFKQVFTTVVHPKLVDRYKNHGFVVTDQAMTNLIRSL